MLTCFVFNEDIIRNKTQKMIYIHTSFLLFEMYPKYGMENQGFIFLSLLFKVVMDLI